MFKRLVKWETLGEYNARMAQKRAAKARKKLERQMRFGDVEPDEEYIEKNIKTFKVDIDILKCWFTLGLGVLGTVLVLGFIWGGYVVANITMI